MDTFVDLICSLVRIHGINATFLLLYPITLVYVLALRYKENQKTLQVIDALIKSNNQLGEEIHTSMQNSSSILAACIYALGGNKDEATILLNTLVRQSREDV